MRYFLIKNQKYIFIALFVILFLGVRPVEFGKDRTFFHGYLIERPVIRIGLGVNLDEVHITASSGMKVYEVKTHYTQIANDVNEILIHGHREKLNEKYIIQVAQAKDREEAENLAQELRTLIERKVFVRASSEKRLFGEFQVLVGDFLTRGDALKFIEHLQSVGFEEAWIIRDEITENESRPLWILINNELKSLDQDSTLYIIPSSSQSYLSRNGRDYRGILILSATRQGIVLVNTLNLDDYLKSVVPGELSPYQFAEIEAQKAQAIAARTYAMKNLGSYSELGYDLVDTPQDQFYLGMNAEHPLSTRAVEETRGEAALYRGKLIDALYTSTCGGRTEDAENVFLGRSLPYLRSTECIYEKQREWPVKAGRSLPPVYIQGENIGPVAASLMSLGIIPFEDRPARYSEPIELEEARTWIGKAGAALGKPALTEHEDGESPGSLSMDTFVDLVIKTFQWQDRIENLFLDQEKEFILDGEEPPAGNGEALAFFIQQGILPGRDVIGSSGRVLSRGETALYLWRVLGSYHDFAKSGIFTRMKQGVVEVESDGRVIELSTDPNMFLIRNFGGIYAFVSQLDLLGGERLRWIDKDDRITLLEVVYPPYSNILDRSSTYHSWRKRISREELSRKINQYYPVGDLKDLKVTKRGSSRRVVDLQIEGQTSRATVRGFRIRRVLGLRETLFIIDRERGEDGRVSHFIFRGKGWGHGVGMCQIGAFGMARAGADYKTILKKYYRDIKVKHVY